MHQKSFLQTIPSIREVITPIDSTPRFPEVAAVAIQKYGPTIDIFCELIRTSSSSAEVLHEIRSTRHTASERMALLKMYRRCVAPVLDTETTKKIRKVPTEFLVETYGHTFKPIGKLVSQFSKPPNVGDALASFDRRAIAIHPRMA